MEMQLDISKHLHFTSGWSHLGSGEPPALCVAVLEKSLQGFFILLLPGNYCLTLLYGRILYTPPISC